MSKKKIAFVFGTRPEAIKMAPLIKAVSANGNFLPTVILTGQHPTMAKEVLSWFGISADIETNIHRRDNSLNELLVQLIDNVSSGLAKLSPDLVIVQGDTGSALAGAVSAFHIGIPVAHLEAGLRTGDVNAPFPEEAYRQMITRIATLHMCPTRNNKENLISEGVTKASIMVTGNTVVDAFQVIRAKLSQNDLISRFSQSMPNAKVVLITAHRRENLGIGMVEISEAIRHLAEQYQDLSFVFPMHPNPSARKEITRILDSINNVSLLEPLEYPEFLELLSRSIIVLTDSGGVQEEAPILGIPTLVLRQSTERPEGVKAGGVKIVGANRVSIIRTFSEIMDDETILNSMSKAVNPYGDGRAQERCVSMIEEYFGFGTRSEEFESDL